MPTKYNTKETKENARHIAERLGIEYTIIPISKLVELNRIILMTQTGKDTQAEKLDRVLEQNIQAKVGCKYYRIWLKNLKVIRKQW